MGYNEDFLKSFQQNFQESITPAVQATAVIEDSFAAMDELTRLTIEQKARREAAILQTAENSEAQVELLENQLKEVKAQNELLKENNKTFSELYEKVKIEAAENKTAAEEARKNAKKNARKATTANWFAGLSLFVSVLSITYAILSSLKIIPWC